MPRGAGCFPSHGPCPWVTGASFVLHSGRSTFCGPPKAPGEEGVGAYIYKGTPFFSALEKRTPELIVQASRGLELVTAGGDRVFVSLPEGAGSC